jgi:uncharacterized oxidoreductase
MNISNNTILISGGTAGIGLEIARLLVKAGNKLIITGRNPQRLEAALAQLPGATGFNGDISSKEDTERLVSLLKTDFPDLNVVINNAGAAFLYKLGNNEGAFEKAQEEMLTNYLSIIRLNESLLPLLKTQQTAAIVNVSSVVAFVPGSLATYSASKAALHSYTQSLRIALAKTSDVKVFELMPPLVDTEFSAPINGKNGIPASQVADEFIEALQNDNYEVRVGNTQYIYDLYLKSPEEALAALNPAS